MAPSSTGGRVALYFFGGVYVGRSAVSVGIVLLAVETIASCPVTEVSSSV